MNGVGSCFISQNVFLYVSKRKALEMPRTCSDYKCRYFWLWARGKLLLHNNYYTIGTLEIPLFFFKKKKKSKQNDSTIVFILYDLNYLSRVLYILYNSIIGIYISSLSVEETAEYKDYCFIVSLYFLFVVIDPS